MLARIRNTWSLARSSWALLQQDRELALLPVIGAVAALVVGAIFFGPVLAMSSADGSGEEFTIPTLGYILAFAGYVAVGGAFNLARAAVVHGANTRMEGGDPTVGSALRGASVRWSAVLGFSVIATTVGLVLGAVRENGGILGRIVAMLGDAAWQVVTYLVLPVIVIEGTGTIQGIKSSTALVKRTWGDQLVANVGFGLLTMVGLLAAVPVVFIGAALGTAGLVVGAALGFAWAVVVLAVSSALTGIFQTALYRQATGRSIPGEFDAAALVGAIGHK